ncbi:MAG: hypothetical protein IJT39_07855 [Bacteroidales bacterium]|nr:hypothetical protein [Bacteroidales bacterium]
MGTIICPNRNCQKELSDQFKECPFCGTPLDGKNSDTHSDGITLNNSLIKRELIVRSGWYTFATIMIILGGLAVAFTLLATLNEDSSWTTFFIVFASYLLELGLWAIIQLLAGIKQSVEKIASQNK